jgi:hypothetical protein
MKGRNPTPCTMPVTFIITRKRIHYDIVEGRELI